MSSPFNMSFDALVAQVTGNQGNVAPAAPEVQPETHTEPVTPTEQTAASVQTSTPTSTPSVENSAPETGALSFEDLVAKSQAQAAGTPLTEEEKHEAVEPAQVSEEPAETPTESLSFEEQIAQAQAAQTSVATAATAEETKVNETAAETAPAEEVKEETVPEATAEAADVAPTAEATENPTADEPAEEKPEEKKKRRRRKRAKDVAEETAEEKVSEEKPADITDNYRVDLPGVTGSKMDPVVNIPASVETNAGDNTINALFTPEEVAAIRADIRSFVRKELKLAVVDAVKELLNDFNR